MLKYNREEHFFQVFFSYKSPRQERANEFARFAFIACQINLADLVELNNDSIRVPPVKRSTRFHLRSSKLSSVDE